MLSVQELKQRLLSALGSSFEIAESRTMVYWLLASIAGISSEEAVINPGLILDDVMVARLTVAADELKNGKPIQYVTGNAYFYGLEMKVNRHVLIPRPETEELVQWIVDDFSHRPKMKVLDIGTGSGCIILALGESLYDPVLTALDISPEALAVASGNAFQLNMKIDFRQADISNREEWVNFEKFDVIVSNPPYVREMERLSMKRNILDFEPPGALFVPDNDALVYYHAIADFSRNRLINQGLVYVEINENLGRETAALFREYGFTNVELRKDIRKKDRMVRAGF
ncbi:MAG: peptide chain release factor N(5)-glutamine methyltransferase [Bacteroidales bacterium]|nr:peptide chain release factor N(5)-glutamine methyltransferase [Bacteroidales bacterium]